MKKSCSSLNGRRHSDQPCAGRMRQPDPTAVPEPTAAAEQPTEAVVEQPTTAGEPNCCARTAAAKYKIGILAPAVTHGWVAAVAYNAEQRCIELADQVEYKLYTSSNAEEMTTQLDDLLTWGAQAIVAFPQWEGMEVPIQSAIDKARHRGQFRYRNCG